MKTKLTKLTSLLAALGLTLTLSLLFLFLFGGEAKAFQTSTFNSFTFSDSFDGQFTASTFGAFEKTFETVEFDDFGVVDFGEQFEV